MEASQQEDRRGPRHKRRAGFRRRSYSMRLYSRRMFMRFSVDEAEKIARLVEEYGFDAPVEFRAGRWPWKQTTLSGLLWSLANKVLERGRYDPRSLSLSEDWPDALSATGASGRVVSLEHLRETV